MFTGIISAVGVVHRAEPALGGLELEIETDWQALALGESVAIDGACLTVTAAWPGSFRQSLAASQQAHSSGAGSERRLGRCCWAPISLRHMNRSAR